MKIRKNQNQQPLNVHCFELGPPNISQTISVKRVKPTQNFLSYNNDILESTDKGNISLRPKLNLRKKSMSVDTEMLFDSERSENKHIHQFREEF